VNSALPPELLERAWGEGGEALEASRSLFRDWVEPLGDSFSEQGVRAYVEGFAPVVARALPDWNARDLLARYERVRRPRPFTGDPAQVSDVVVLSRVTLGADVAITSVVMDAALRRFPNALIHLASNEKNAEIFAGAERLRHFPAPYARTGALRDRLAASVALGDALRERLPSATLVLDPDSRLSQLGLVPLCDEDRYFFLESRTAGGEGSDSVVTLASRWCRQTLGVEGRAWTKPARGLGGPSRLCVSLGTGENPSKGLGAEFECELVRRLAALGLPMLIDKGMGGEEGDRVERAIAASGAAPGQIETWLGPFAPFAREIARAPLYAGYDSAGQHVAAAAGTRLRCIFAGAPSTRFFERWKPAGRGECRVARVDSPGEWNSVWETLGLGT
jgi:ADP-heptose:LPS heptosyltransferase